jgi:hypothetical protein
MARFLFPAAALSLLATLSGCSLKGGMVRDSVTQVHLSADGPFQIIKTDLGHTETNHLLFCSINIAGIEVYRALMAELHQQAQLGPNEALVNLREDHKFVSYLGLYCTDQITLSADVVRFGQ